MTLPASIMVLHTCARSTYPKTRKHWPFIWAFASVGVSAWAAFLLFATNQEKLTSSVVKQTLQTVRENEEPKDVPGDATLLEPAWYLNGDPWIHGNVNLSFRLKGHRGSGTLYVTSIRKAKGESFSPLGGFSYIEDDKRIVNILPQITSSRR